MYIFSVKSIETFHCHTRKSLTHYFMMHVHSVAPEGRRLAEHLVACFAASSDPIADAGECLTSAVLWLQSLKLRWHGAEEHALSGSSLISIGSPTFGNLSLGVNSSVNMLLQPQYASGMVPGVLMGMGNPLPRPNSSVSISSNTRTLLRASLKWEDYKDRPSDFLKVSSISSLSFSHSASHKKKV